MLQSPLKFVLPPIRRVFGSPRLLVLICFCVMGWTATPVWSAGCSYHPSEDSVSVFQNGESGRMTGWSWWSAGQVTRVYERGVFKYYVLPVVANDAKPCKGPNCGRSDSEPSLEVVVVHELPRAPQALSAGYPALFPPRSCGRIDLCNANHCDGTHCDILRPPRRA